MKRAGCCHGDGDTEILAIMPAHGVGFATLYDPQSDDPELDVAPIVGWAHVRRDVAHCDCAETTVVPLTIGWTTLHANDERSESETVDCRIVGPGQRPVLRRDDSGRCHIRLEPGTWEPGPQDIGELPPRRRTA